MDESAVEVTGMLRVTTQASVWLVNANSYLRMPRTEQPRAVTTSIDGALDDLVWHSHDGVWLVVEGNEMWLRLLPAGRAPGSVGVVTGVIVEAIAGGPVTTVAPVTDEPTAAGSRRSRSWSTSTSTVSLVKVSSPFDVKRHVDAPATSVATDATVATTRPVEPQAAHREGTRSR